MFCVWLTVRPAELVEKKWIAVKIDDESSCIPVLRNLDSGYLSAFWLWINVYKRSHILDLNMETIAIFVIKKWELFQICSLKLLKTQWRRTQEQDRTNLLQLPIGNLACSCEWGRQPETAAGSKKAISSLQLVSRSWGTEIITY